MQGIPTSKATQSANIIRDAILRGEWTQYLPGERTLAKELMISRACLRQALEILTTEKVLGPVEKSKRRTILLQSSPEKSTSKVIFFSPEPAHRATPMVLEQIAQLRYYLAKEDQSVEHLSSAVFKNPQTSDQTMQQLTSVYPHAHWILHQCPEHVQRWFSKQEIKSTVLGSVFPGIHLPNVDIDFYSACRHATGHLLAQGHQNICLIRFRSKLAGDAMAGKGMDDAIQAHQGSGDIRHQELSHNFHVERLTTALDQLCASSQRPSAIVVVNVHHFITTFSHLMSRGIRIPEDISLISLSYDKVLDCFSPLPMRYTVKDKLIRTLAQKIINPPSPSSDTETQHSVLIPEMVAGRTVAKFHN